MVFFLHAEMIDEYLLDFKVHNLSKYTIESYKSQLKKIILKYQ